MSFFDDASLAFLPSGGAGKDGKAYSIKPTDGTGDFTFSRGSNLTATRVGPTGLIEKGRENLLLQSNQFDTTWSLSSVSVTSGQSGYDGSSDAWELEATATTSARIEVSNSNTGVLRASVYVKEGTTNWVHLNTGSQRRVWFNLSTGSVGTITNSANTFDAKIEAVSGAAGWFRISYVVIDPTHFRIYPANSDGGNAVTGDNIYIQDAQLELGLAATDYIESGASTGKAGLLENEPRFDYSGGATCPSLLLEPQRVQLVSQSEYINSGGGWGYSGGLTTQVNSIASPEGVTNGTKVVIGSNQYGELRSPTISQFAATYAISVFAKAGDLDWFIFQYNDSTVSNYVRVWFNLSTGAVGSNVQVGWTIVGTPTIESIGTNGWYRCNIVLTTTALSINRMVMFGATGDGAFGATENSYFYAYGAQLEEASYPTSYIPNHSGGSATRTEETTSVLTLPETLTDNYTLFFDFREINTVNGWIAFLDSSNNAVYSFYSYSGHYDVNNGSAYILESSADPNGKIALKQSGSSIKVFVNGVDKTKAGTTANLADIEKFQFRSRNLNNSATLRQMLVFNEALSDADCITLTT